MTFPGVIEMLPNSFMKLSIPTIESLLAIIEAQAAQIKQLEARIHEQELRLNKNSSNSSKPPSSDGLRKPPRTVMFHTAQTPLPYKGKRGRQPKRTGHNLLLRLFHYKHDVLRFLHDPEVPFTNNDAERDLRMMKCKQKVSGGFRTNQGAEHFARIRGFISTVRKQGFNVLSAIQAIFSDNIPIPAGS